MSFIEEAKALINGFGLIPVNLMFEISENIYHSLALVPPNFDLEQWHPYKAHRDLRDYGIWVIFYWFDDELTAQNVAGKLIYIEPDPEDYDEGEEMPEVNCDCWEEVDLDEILMQVKPKHEAEVLARLRAIPNTDRWDSAIRSDE